MGRTTMSKKINSGDIVHYYTCVNDANDNKTPELRTFPCMNKSNNNKCKTCRGEWRVKLGVIQMNKKLNGHICDSEISEDRECCANCMNFVNPKTGNSLSSLLSAGRCRKNIISGINITQSITPGRCEGFITKEN